MKVAKLTYRYDKKSKTIQRIEGETKHYSNYRRAQLSSAKERMQHYRQKDLTDKTVLDVGCSYGGMCIEALDLGAAQVHGIDHNSHAIDIINAHQYVKNHKLTVECVDIESPSVFRRLYPRDTVFLLAIVGTSKFSEKWCLLTQYARLTKEVMYVETHRNEDYMKYFFYLMYYTDFRAIEVLTNVPECGRYLIRCSRKVPKALKDKDGTLIVPSGQSPPTITPDTRAVVFTRR